MLAVLTGPVRSGKSRLALELARSTGVPVLVAVAGAADDPEMIRRIARHRADRPSDVRVLEIADARNWRTDVTAGACLVVDCLGTLVARLMDSALGPMDDLVDEADEAALQRAVDEVVDWLVSREGHTVVVTNEVGWGIVPAHPSGRLFRDVVGRANARLVANADGAWLVVAGQAIDLKTGSADVRWPQT
jgi:adenosylcobinamide kinase/adenosylcobinamide-phosphate guanylyltransferase